MTILVIKIGVSDDLVFREEEKFETGVVRHLECPKFAIHVMCDVSACDLLSHSKFRVNRIMWH